MTGEGEETKTCQYKIREMARDVLAALSISYVFIVYPIWSVRYTMAHGFGKTPIESSLMLAACIPSFYGYRRLVHRDLDVPAKRYPFTATLGFRIALAASIPFMMFLPMTIQELLR